jgi:hypothetical protein
LFVGGVCIWFALAWYRNYIPIFSNPRAELGSHFCHNTLDGR